MIQYNYKRSGRSCWLLIGVAMAMAIVAMAHFHVSTVSLNLSSKDHSSCFHLNEKPEFYFIEGFFAYSSIY